MCGQVQRAFTACVSQRVGDQLGNHQDHAVGCGWGRGRFQGVEEVMGGVAGLDDPQPQQAGCSRSSPHHARGVAALVVAQFRSRDSGAG